MPGLRQGEIADLELPKVVTSAYLRTLCVDCLPPTPPATAPQVHACQTAYLGVSAMGRSIASKIPRCKFNMLTEGPCKIGESPYHVPRFRDRGICWGNSNLDSDPHWSSWFTTHNVASRHYLPRYTGACGAQPTSPRFQCACYQGVGRICVTQTQRVYSSIYNNSIIDCPSSLSHRQTIFHCSHLPTMSNEKHEDIIEPAQSSTDSINIGKADLDDGEVFRTGEGLVDFRTVSWIHTSVIFLKRRCILILDIDP